MTVFRAIYIYMWYICGGPSGCQKGAGTCTLHLLKTEWIQHGFAESVCQSVWRDEVVSRDRHGCHQHSLQGPLQSLMAWVHLLVVLSWRERGGGLNNISNTHNGLSDWGPYELYLMLVLDCLCHPQNNSTVLCEFHVNWVWTLVHLPTSQEPYPRLMSIIMFSLYSL